MVKGFISYPSSKSLNPFVSILNKHLQDQGWEEKEFDIWLKPISLFKKRRQIKILYFHWPESFWRANSLLFSCIKALAFIIFTSFAKSLGIKLVFSGHNVLPHFKAGNKHLELYMRKWVVKNFDLTIGHARNAKDDFEQTLQLTLKNYTLAIHGNYCDYYNQNLLQEDTRRELMLPQNEVIILLKYDSNPYKGSYDFIKKAVEQKIDYFLLITGSPSEEFLSILKAYKKYKIVNGNEHNIKGFLSESMLVKTLTASDFVVLPYKEITTSGAYFLALTFHKPVIAPDLPFFKMHSTPNTALLYNNYSYDLRPIFEQIKSGWKVELKEINELKEKFTWKESGKTIGNSFNKLIEVC